MIAFLKEDHIGASSKIRYATKGEKVQVIQTNDNMALVTCRQIKFWINTNKLETIK